VIGDAFFDVGEMVGVHFPYNMDTKGKNLTDFVISCKLTFAYKSSNSSLYLKVEPLSPGGGTDYP